MKPTWINKAANTKAQRAKAQRAKTSLLKWKPMKDFPGEEVANIGPFEFSVSDEGHWYVDFTTKSTGDRRKTYVSLRSGKTIGRSPALSIKRAKMQCERFARLLVQSCEKIRKLTK